MGSCQVFNAFIPLLSFLFFHFVVSDKFQKIGKETDFSQFRTRPDILAPRWNITVYDAEKISPGYWFVAPYKDIESRERGEAWIGPHIYDGNGELVWSGTPLLNHFKATDLRIAQINGTDVITAIYPHDNAALVIDSNYQILQTLIHSSSWEYSNMHDFNVVEDGTRALVLTKDVATTLSAAQSKLGGFDGECVVRGDGLKYLDITTLPPTTLFFWNGTDHIGLDETSVFDVAPSIDERCSGEKKWDIHHFNSIDRFPDGDFLVSSRATSTLYKISRQNGTIVWRIGGSKSDFHLPTEAKFQFQHHARVHSQNNTHIVISLVDNAKDKRSKDEDVIRSHSAGIILALHTDTMDAELIGEYPHPHGDYTVKRGSAHVLRNGNVFMGWADDILITEHSPDGRVLMEAHILPQLDSYRSYKFEWVGRPLEPPNVYSAAFVAGGRAGTMVYVSWNGATEVARWDLYECDSLGGGKQFITSAIRESFETGLTSEWYAHYVIVEAFDGNGDSLGTSRVVRTIPAVEEEDDDDDVSWVAEGDAFESASELYETDSSIHGGMSGVGQTYRPPEDFNDSSASQLPYQFGLFLAGFGSCVGLCLALWVMRHYDARSWWRVGSNRYERVPIDSQEDIEGKSGGL